MWSEEPQGQMRTLSSLIEVTPQMLEKEWPKIEEGRKMEAKEKGGMEEVRKKKKGKTRYTVFKPTPSFANTNLFEATAEESDEPSTTAKTESTSYLESGTRSRVAPDDACDGETPRVSRSGAASRAASATKRRKRAAQSKRKRAAEEREEIERCQKASGKISGRSIPLTAPVGLHTYKSVPGESGPSAGPEITSMLNAVLTIEPEGLNSVVDKDGYEEIEMAVDSGATETVVSDEMLQSVQVNEGPASRRGVKYEVANGVRIPNEGEKKFSATTGEGITRGITAQVCNVNKPLLSVSRMVNAGNKVVFDADGSYIEDKVTAERMWLEYKGGMYMLRVWAKPAGF